eukprot:scaffold9795_cov146-Isochrysis_galbana.AAC.1
MHGARNRTTGASRRRQDARHSRTTLTGDHQSHLCICASSLSMEVEPDDARPASSASGPADTAPTDMSGPKRPRDSASGNMVSQSPAPYAPAMPAGQFVRTECLSTDTGRACQSLAHHTTLIYGWVSQ